LVKQTGKSYSQIIEALKPETNLEKVITCKMCGQPMYWFMINEVVGFWLHRGKDVAICSSLNPMMKGKPVIAQNMKFYKKIYGLWQEKVQDYADRQNTRKRKKLH